MMGPQQASIYALLKECRRLVSLARFRTLHLVDEAELLAFVQLAKALDAIKGLSNPSPAYDRALERLSLCYGEAYVAFDSLKRAGKTTGGPVAFLPPEALVMDLVRSSAMLVAPVARALPASEASPTVTSATTAAACLDVSVSPNGDPVVEVLDAEDVHGADDEADDGDGAEDAGSEDNDADDDPDVAKRRVKILALGSRLLGQVIRSTGLLAVVLHHIKQQRLYKPTHATWESYATKVLGLEVHMVRLAIRAGGIARQVAPSDTDDIINGLLGGVPISSLPEIPNQTTLIELGKTLKAVPPIRHQDIVARTMSGRLSARELVVLAREQPTPVQHAAEPREDHQRSPSVSPVAAPPNQPAVAEAVDPRSLALASTRLAASGPTSTSHWDALLPSDGARKRVPPMLQAAFGSLMAAIDALESQAPTHLPEEVRHFATMLLARVTSGLAKHD